MLVFPHLVDEVDQQLLKVPQLAGIRNQSRLEVQGMHRLQDPLHARINVHSFRSNVHKAQCLEVLEPNTLLHVNVPHFFYHLSFLFNFASVIYAEFVDQVPGVNLESQIPIRNYQNILNMLGDLPEAI